MAYAVYGKVAAIPAAEYCRKVAATPSLETRPGLSGVSVLDYIIIQDPKPYCRAGEA